MKIIFICIVIFLYGIGYAQDTNNMKYIEVTGSAELEVEPDEIIFVIGIEEYWKEEFEKSSKFKDYQTKIPIEIIENSIMSDLSALGVERNQITIKDVGNYWRYLGKEFQIKKQFEISLTDFNKIDEIINKVNKKGIDFMRIGEFKNKNITEYRKQVKIEALKAAKAKAEYLLGSIGKNVADVISIIEINNDNNNYYWRPQNEYSNTMMSSGSNTNEESYRKIKLRYEIKCKFEIK